MKCKVLCFLLCVLFCFSCFSLSSSAVNVPDDVDSLLERGWVYDESDGSYFLSEDIIASMPSTLISPEPYYPNFDISKIPWNLAPSVVQEYLYMSWTENFTSSDSVLPFVLVRVAGSSVIAYVGYNLGFGVDASDRYPILTPFFPGGSSNSILLSSACYSATFRLSDYSVSVDWHKLTPSVFGSNNNLVSYGSTLAYTSSEYDFYFSGGNRVSADSRAGILALNYNKLIYDESGALINSPIFANFNVSNSGFSSGNFIQFQDYSETLLYCQYFIPTSLSQFQAQQQQQIIDGQQEMIEKQEESNETQKGMWESIKALPSQIANSIKGLFVPSEGFFDTFTTEFETYFKDRLGVLYELPEAAINILQQFLSFSPSKEGYYIPIPRVAVPVPTEEGGTTELVVFEEQNYYFTFLSEGPFATLYTFYRSFCWLVAVLGLISLCMKKFNKITGG